jgi:opacity protein-like surface antigen
MKLFAVLCVLAMTLAASAQDYPKAEIFGGYNYASSDVTSPGRTHLNGWNGAATANINRWFGVKADFSGLYGSKSVGNILGAPCPPFCNAVNVRTHIHTFLFGPQLSYRTDKFTPFAHALFGVGHTSVSIAVPVTSLPGLNFGLSDTNFAMALGGGVDFNFRRRLAWRVGADYLQTRSFGSTPSNFRVATGIVYHF